MANSAVKPQQKAGLAVALFFLLCCLGGGVVTLVAAFNDTEAAKKDSRLVVGRALSVWMNMGGTAELKEMWDRQGITADFDKRAAEVREDSLKRWGKFVKLDSLGGELTFAVGTQGSIPTFKARGFALFEKGSVPVRGTLIQRDGGKWRIFTLTLGTPAEQPKGPDQ